MNHMDHQMTMSGHDHMSMDMGNMSGMGGMDHMMEDMKKKFWIAVILTVPMIIMSPMMGMTFGWQITFPGSDWIVALLGTILYFYCGQPFFAGAKGELKQHKPAMMTLITMGITVAYIYSVYGVIANNIFHVHPMVTTFFWELATLIVIMLAGHVIEMKTLSNAGSAVDALAKLLPQKAHVVGADGKIQDVALGDLTNGETVQIRAGEKIPADATVTSGTTSVNESLVTGEAKAVEKKPGDDIIGGSVNGDGTIEAKVTATGDGSYLSNVVKLVQTAQSSKSNTETRANKVAGWLFYAAVSVAIIAFFVWLALRGLSVALPIAVTVLIIACPHALGLAVPLVSARSTSIAATHGLLYRNKNAIEQLNKVKYALIDKTGTLTEGHFQVTAVKSLSDSLNDDQVLNLIADLETGSSHPLAVGILTTAKAKDLKIVTATDVSQQSGIGQFGTINGQQYGIVSVAYLQQKGLPYNSDQFKQLASEGNTVSFLVSGQQVLGVIALGDQIKQNSKEMIAYMLNHKLTPVMLTGDNQETAAAVANRLGIAEFKAQLMPADKEKIVEDYQKSGKVIFIGDGVNDAPSLAQADIGIAIGSGTDVAIQSADVVLVSSDPKNVIDFLDLGKRTNDKMTENLWWAAGYNIIAIPLAAGVLAPIGFILPPMAGALVMSCSTIIVALNALSLHLNPKVARETK
nr:copper-translocating P-type ATPase [Levilactobacillus bambusae]